MAKGTEVLTTDLFPAGGCAGHIAVPHWQGGVGPSEKPTDILNHVRDPLARSSSRGCCQGWQGWDVCSVPAAPCPVQGTQTPTAGQVASL